MADGAVCPKCGAAVSRVDPVAVEISEQYTRVAARGIAYVCQKCRTVLGIEQDPQQVFFDLRSLTKHLLPKDRP